MNELDFMDLFDLDLRFILLFLAKLVISENKCVETI